MISEPTHKEIGSLVPLEKERDYATEAKEQARALSIEDELHKFFLSQFDRKKQNEKEWLDNKKEWVRSRNYNDGRQFGQVNNSLQWVDYQLRPSENTYFANNAFHSNVQGIVTVLTNSNPRLTFSHISKDSRKGQLISRIAEKLYELNRQRTFRDGKPDQENLSLALNGLALRYTYWNHNGRKEKVPQFQGKDIQGGEALSVCSYCSAPMTERCQYCGSTETKQIASQGYSANVVSGYDEIDCGENDWISPDPLGITFYLKATSLADTPYLIWEQSIVTDVLQSQYPDIKIIDGSESRELQMKDEQDIKTPNDQFFADGNSVGKGTAEFVQGWFDPPLYAQRVIKQDAKLRNGMVLKANDKLGKYFPNGLYLAKNGKNILDVWNEDKGRKWTASPYVTRLGSLVGGGTSVALSNQDNLNDLRNLQMKSIMTDAFAKEFVNAMYLEGENVPDDPTERAIVTNLPEGARIVGTVIDRLPPSPLSADAYALEEKILGSMTNQMGTMTTTMEGADGIQAAKTTATGYLAYQQQMLGKFAPMLSAKANLLDRNQAIQFLENELEYRTEKQWAEIAGDYGQEGVRAFRQCDIRKELIVEVAGESYMPDTLQDRRMKSQAYVELSTQAMIPPDSEMGAFLGEQYDIPKSLVGFDAAKSIAYEQIDAFKAIADQVVGALEDIPSFDIMLDPVALQMGQLITTQANKPISSPMDDLEAIRETFMDWWQTDAGRNASNALKAAILFRKEEIDMAIIQRTQADQQKALASQAPMMQAQAEQANAQAEAEGQNADRQIEADEAKDGRQAEMKEMEMTGKAVESVMSSEENDKQRAHEKEVLQKTQSHDLSMAKEKSKQDLFKSRKEKKKASK